MARIRIKLIKSKIGNTIRQKRTLEALGLKKMNSVVEHEASPQIMGMVKKVNHLISTENI